jgi:ribosome modulation factor
MRYTRREPGIPLDETIQWAEGYKAGQENKPKDCPYPDDLRKRRWTVGWTVGNAERQLEQLDRYPFEKE